MRAWHTGTARPRFARLERLPPDSPIDDLAETIAMAPGVIADRKLPIVRFGHSQGDDSHDTRRTASAELKTDASWRRRRRVVR